MQISIVLVQNRFYGQILKIFYEKWSKQLDKYRFGCYRIDTMKENRRWNL